MIKLIRITITINILAFISGCSVAKPTYGDTDALLDFAESNCIFWYLKSKDYEVSDIKKVTAGIVEMSTYSANKFQQTALLVKEYKPDISRNDNVDLDLLKCFTMKKDKLFLKKLEIIRVQQ
ncbi:hypothetical protein GCM10009410_10340 [Shewanella ulleungensis]|uniref:Lipoprotein n=1 Tax=Shewanella ulleungensis TaxID=2282699 RepID=A0ABQ2QHS5_9GAMM|nr:hypothetical protein GCM10009410_10340 [Shewanella ulleungensis]